MPELNKSSPGEKQGYKGPGLPLTVGVIVVMLSAGVLVLRNPSSYLFGFMPIHSPAKSTLVTVTSRTSATGHQPSTHVYRIHLLKHKTARAQHTRAVVNELDQGTLPRMIGISASTRPYGGVILGFTIKAPWTVALNHVI